MKLHAFVVSALLFAAGLVAQTEAQLRAQLADKDLVVAETARRRLCVRKDLSKETRQWLVSCVGNEQRPAGLRWAAGTVLRGLGTTEPLAACIRSKDAKLQVLAVPYATREPLQQLLFTKGHLEARMAALSRMEDEGWLEDPVLLRLLREGPDELREMAALIVVRERVPFPAKLIAELSNDPKPRTVLLELLAARPRQHAGGWLLRLLERNEQPLAPVERVLAIGALPVESLNVRLGREVLRAAMQNDPTLSFRAHLAASRFSAKLADKLTEDFLAMARAGSIHGLLPCFVRVSRQGEEKLLVASNKLSSDSMGAVCHWLASRKSPALQGVILAALGGKGDLPPHLLRLVGPYLKEKQHAAKVVSYLGKAGKQAIRAYQSLLEARIYHPDMLTHALDDEGGRRSMALLRSLGTQLPEAALMQLLSDEMPAVGTVACGVLAAAGPLSKEGEAALMELAKSRLVQVRLAALRAVVVSGSEAGGAAAWRALSESERQEHGIEWLLGKPRLWSHERLLRERQRLKKSHEQHARERRQLEKEGGTAEGEQDNQGELLQAYYLKVLLALAKLKDRGAEDELMRRIPDLTALMLQRGRATFLKRLDVKQIERLRGMLMAGDAKLNSEQRLEVLAWLAKTPGVDMLLTSLWKKDPSHEVRMAALGRLLAGPGAGPLLERMERVLQKPLDEVGLEEVFEVVGSMALPLSQSSLRMLAKLVVAAPLANPRHEVALSLKSEWGSSRGEYPLLQPIANLLRRDEKALPGKAMEASIRKDVRQAGRLYLVNRRRVGLFLSVLSSRADLYADAAPALARLLLDSPDAAEVFVGPALLALAEHAEARRDYAAAAKLYRRANSRLMRWHLPRFIQMAFVGDADPSESFQPFASLAAKPYLCEARVHLAAGQREAAEKLLRKATLLAYGDADTLAEVRSISKEKSSK